MLKKNDCQILQKNMKRASKNNLRSNSTLFYQKISAILHKVMGSELSFNYDRKTEQTRDKCLLSAYCFNKKSWTFTLTYLKGRIQRNKD